jgi:hypothetical protein
MAMIWTFMGGKQRHTKTLKSKAKEQAIKNK